VAENVRTTASELIFLGVTGPDRLTIASHGPI
jgi:hypothetical protein